MMIGIPMVLYLPFALTDWETLAPIFSLMAIGGFALLAYVSRTKGRWKVHKELIAFILLSSPIIYRLVSVPLHLFKYSLFVIPFTVFVIMYILSLFISLKEIKNQ